VRVLRGRPGGVRRPLLVASRDARFPSTG
jgi:hypothetical protein